MSFVPLRKAGAGSGSLRAKEWSQWLPHMGGASLVKLFCSVPLGMGRGAHPSGWSLLPLCCFGTSAGANSRTDLVREEVEEGGIRASSASSCLGGMSSPCHASAHVQASGERAARQEQQLEVMQAQNAGLKSCLQTRTASAGYLGCDLPPGSQVAHGSEWGW